MYLWRKLGLIVTLLCLCLCTLGCPSAAVDNGVTPPAAPPDSPPDDGEVTTQVNQSDPDNADSVAALKAIDGIKLDTNDDGNIVLVDFNGAGGGSDAMLEHLVGLPFLEAVHCSGPEITSEGMVHLAKVPSLITLNTMESSGLDDKAVETLATLPNLENLYTQDCKVSDAGVAHFKTYPKLRRLRLVQLHLNAVSLDHLKDCKDLEMLDCHEVRFLSDEGLKNIAGMTNLRYLGLWGRTISDLGLEHLAGLTNLEVLKLVNTLISDSGLQHIAKMEQLKELSLNETDIGDEGLNHLKGFTNLEHLDLGSTKITDAGLEKLTGMEKLRHLDITSCTGVTDEGIAKLKEALPDLEIVEN